METLDLILQTSAFTLLMLFVCLAARDGWKHPAIRFSILASASVSALFLQSSGYPVWLGVLVGLMNACNIAFIWWACLAMLDENFKLRPLHWIGLVAYGTGTIPYRFSYYDLIPNLPDWFDLSVDIVTFALVAHLVWKAIEGYREDLLAERRGLRVFFIFGCAAAIFIAIFGENVLRSVDLGQYSVMLTAAVTLPIAIALNLWVTRMHPEIMLFQPVRLSAPALPDIDPKDADAHRRLTRIMQEENAYTEHGLTIGTLAGKVGIPEHQLRALINRAMGHRNFASFLNAYRLQAAKEALADPKLARMPILTIAMDAGYGSLAPFNRAFKQAEGITPTAYRNEALAKHAADQS